MNMHGNHTIINNNYKLTWHFTNEIAQFVEIKLLT